MAKYGAADSADIPGKRRIAQSLSALRPEAASTTRGAREAQLYRTFSPSVVLVLSEESLGSGSLLSADGTILTNYHVIADSPQVGVIFKPAQEGQQLTKASLVRAEVIKIDEVADLAILKVAEVPSNVAPLQLGSLSAVPVGSDVHAIGHPTGESWTYTRGIVSQIRRNYEWTTESGLPHHATVIQTQTPINPGNSGGPLLDDSGKLVGVNSFKAQGEALNFAVSIDDVRAFLQAPTSRSARKTASAVPDPADSCDPPIVGEGRSKNPVGRSFSMDANCDGTVDSYAVIPDDGSLPMLFYVDEDQDGIVDIMFIDRNRDGDPEQALYDTNGDGKAELLGHFHPGSDEPYKVEPYVG